MESALIGGLISVIGVLAGIGYRNIDKRLGKLERKTGATLTAMVFFIAGQNPVPNEVLSSLKSAMEDS
ncbi:hypothetical protein LCGC14_0794560 [marine sediment metagenome]|uniref:Uncharacterized protein n=1 Tax=marine sediment metagenome TaxID=412755 RepID=A0A0F9PRJ6_9ZZZZ